MDSFTEYSISGLPLKKKTFLYLINREGYTLADIAELLELSTAEVEDRLETEKSFSEYDIRKLVYLLGAQNAVKAIKFPSLKERYRIEQAAFGKIISRRKHKGRSENE